MDAPNALCIHPIDLMTKNRLPICFLGFLCILPLASCDFMSMVGPQKGGIIRGEHPYKLISVRSRSDIPRVGSNNEVGQIPIPLHGSGYSDKVRSRDSLQFTITDLSEQSPFFTKGSNIGPLEVPEDGQVSIPYVGQIQVIGLSLAQIASDLNAKLKPVSSTAQANVARTARIPRTANVIGEVKSSGAIPLEQANLNSIDLLAAAGGAASDDFLYKYILRRNNRDYVSDYEFFRQHPFPVEAGDLLTVTKDTHRHFYVLGAIMKTRTVPFPVAAPTLADAIGAASGLDEQRSDPSGVFVFRKGNPDLVYTLNLKDPACILLSQRFPIRGEDIIYVTEAPLARWNRLISQLLPTSTAAFNLARVNQFGAGN
jgi:polysaccharide biosynthesis/export protein